MNGIATLPMYDWPELRAQVDGFYAALRARVPDLPAKLIRPASEQALHALWRSPALLLGQTCWGPMHVGLQEHVHVLAQPDYSDVPGGQGIDYRSVIVMRAGALMEPPPHPGASLPQGLAGLRAAVNSPLSLSGCLALAEDAGLRDLATDALVTGSHRASIRAVAAGKADFAAIDCRSWALARAYEPMAHGLIATGWTALRPGLPFITARATPRDLRQRLSDALAETGAVSQPLSKFEEIP
ncbi:MAG: PhnD/SsuA/transferrin family substrate-binding protein [Natronohydrobacter sp.]|nr:PhnD/SsuA/transferrin family substrate-binding protein [Natronohydrobacter sp.]